MSVPHAGGGPVKAELVGGALCGSRFPITELHPTLDDPMVTPPGSRHIQAVSDPDPAATGRYALDPACVGEDGHLLGPVAVYRFVPPAAASA